VARRSFKPHKRALASRSYQSGKEKNISGRSWTRQIATVNLTQEERFLPVGCWVIHLDILMYKDSLLRGNLATKALCLHWEFTFVARDLDRVRSCNELLSIGKSSAWGQRTAWSNNHHDVLHFLLSSVVFHSYIHQVSTAYPNFWVWNNLEQDSFTMVARKITGKLLRLRFCCITTILNEAVRSDTHALHQYLQPSFSLLVSSWVNLSTRSQENIQFYRTWSIASNARNEWAEGRGRLDTRCKSPNASSALRIWRGSNEDCRAPESRMQARL
jgi:hypothetical protein